MAENTKKIKDFISKHHKKIGNLIWIAIALWFGYNILEALWFERYLLALLWLNQIVWFGMLVWQTRMTDKVWDLVTSYKKLTEQMLSYIHKNNGEVEIPINNRSAPVEVEKSNKK